MKLKCLPLLIALLACPLGAEAQGTAFSYQGKLVQNGVPVNGPMDLRFTLFGTAVSANPVAGPVFLEDHPVEQGLLTASLDFGGGVFNGPSRWMEVAVRPDSSTGQYTVLAPRREVLPAPYAIYSAGASGAGITPPLMMPQSSASNPPYAFRTDQNTGMFSPEQDVLSFATSGAQRLRISSVGDVGINIPGESSYRLMSGDSTHQIALYDIESAKIWTLTTVNNSAFGIYENGNIQRFRIDSGGRVTVGGRPVIYDSGTSEVMTLRTTAVLTVTNMGSGVGVDGNLSWGSRGFTSPPRVFVGDFSAGRDGPGDFDQLLITCHSVTTTGCKVRVYNAGNTSATVRGGTWNIIIIGTR